MLDFERVLDLLGGLTLLRFFPSDTGARLELAKLVGRMAANEAQVEWLVQRTCALCNEWPGPLALRQIFCSRCKPADGIEAGGTSMFPDGPPSEKVIEASPLLALPPGHVATVDAGYDRSIRLLAAAKDLNRPDGAQEKRRELLRQEHSEYIAAHPIEHPVTQADIDLVVNELREKRARAELGETA